MRGPEPRRDEPAATEAPEIPANRAGRRLHEREIRRSLRRDFETAELLGLTEEVRGPRYALRP